MTHKRWYCADCRREWVMALAWDEATCPRCASAHIERVTYTPIFPGADYHHPSVGEVTIQPSPVPPAIDPKRVLIAENQTLAISSPEFA